MSAPLIAFAHSYLFVPGSRPDRFAKALDSGAHAVIVDLEDAVAAQDKHQAREWVATWLDNHPDRQVLLRINAAGTPWHDDDLQLAEASNVAAVVVPKVERVEALPVLRTKPTFPIIESAKGFAQLEAIATHRGVGRLLFGTYDFRADLGLGDAAEVLHYFNARLVLVSRIAGLPPPVDGVAASISEDAQWLAEARRSRQFGFGGKLCIHPRQVGSINAGFAPSTEEVRWATRVIGAMGHNATAVIDGEFVDRPILLRAKSIVARHSQGEKESPLA